MDLKTKLVSLMLCAGLSACNQADTDLGLCQNADIAFELGKFRAIPSGSVQIVERFNASAAPQKRQVQIESFEIQEHEVTYGQFKHFVEETDYVTDAEKVLEDKELSGSAVFKQVTDSESRWTLDRKMSWNSNSSTNTKEDLEARYPVVHVSINDARAYADWAGGRLPTALEWEHAANLGLFDVSNPFSGAYDSNGKPIANTWQGVFPIVNTGKDGYKGAAPVACFQRDKVGLFDMIGNVWELTDTPASNSEHIIKGGSFLCAENYCRSYNPFAQQAHEDNFSTNHVGFRVVRDI